MRFPVRLALTVPMVGLAAYAVVATVRLAYADRLAQRDTVEALLRANRLVPGNADYLARVAILDPSRGEELSAALHLNPREPSWWVMQSIFQEQDGNLTAAEQSLRQANLVSRYYAPRWSMAAFYYRHDNTPEFVRWAQRALSAGSGANEPLFQMAFKLGLTPQEVLEGMVTEEPAVIHSYLLFLIKQGMTEQIYATGAKLLAAGSKSNRGGILDASEALFTAGKINEAVELWNRAIQAGWIAYSPLEPSAGKSLTSGTFREEQLQRGFDWKYLVPLEILISHSDQGGLRFDFSGNQPESCELLMQYVPLLPARRYQLMIRYRTEGILPGAGLRWTVARVPDGHTLAGDLLSLAPEQPVVQTYQFETSSPQVPTRFLLWYARQPGTTRIQGRLWIESVRLDVVP